jgi:RNA polymerase sigma-70 factor, ECF subfamily
MGTLMANNSAETTRLLEQARAGDKDALNQLFVRHRACLRRMVDLRLDRRLQARIDASDVIQEAMPGGLDSV